MTLTDASFNVVGRKNISRSKAQFPGLHHSIIGRLTTGIFKFGLAALLLWGVREFMSNQRPLDQLMLTLLVAFLIAEISAVLVERPIVVRRNRSNPGGWVYATAPLVVVAIISFVVSYLVTQSLSDTILITGVLLLCNVTEMLFLKTWVPGPTPEEEHEKFNEFRAMTKEHFADDVEEIKRRARKKSRE